MRWVALINGCFRVAAKPALNGPVNWIWFNTITGWIPERWPACVPNNTRSQEFGKTSGCNVLGFANNLIGETIATVG